MEYQELGMTSNEAKTYETILRLKKAGASEISKNSGVPYGRIYTILESLEEKNLIKCLSGEKKQYIAADPQALRTIIDTRIKRLMEIDNQVKELEKIYEDEGLETISIFKGRKNLHKALKETKTPKEYIYSVIHDFNTNPNDLRQIKEMIKNRVEVKSLGRIESETSSKLKEFKIISKEIKPIENQGLKMEIIDDIEVNIHLIKSDSVIIIRDKAFAKVMKQLYIKYYMSTDYEEL